MPDFTDSIGHGVDGAFDVYDYLVKRPAATFFMKFEGDSMVADGIFDGDLLVVDRSLHPAPGDIVVASVDGEFLARRLRTLQKTVQAPIDYFGKVVGVVRRL